MSLINDALRRAKQAQKEKPPPQATPGLRPIEPELSPAKTRPGIFLPVALGAAGLATLLLLWQLAGHRSSSSATEGSPSLSVAARPLTTAEPTVAPSEHSGKRSSAPGSETGRDTVATPPESGSANIANFTVASGTNAVAASSETTETNRLAAAAEAAPPPLKLQSIVFNPKRPSAMINGRVMFVGDKIRDVRVTAIRPAEVILIGSGRTNILSLEP